MPILKIKDENGNWTKVPFVGNDNEIFWVTYGTTTYAEITAALGSGKEVLCKYSDKMYQYSWVNSANSAYILTCTYSSTIYWISITPGNVYSTSSRQVYEGIESTSLTEASDSLVYTSLKTQNLINAVDAKVEDAKEAKDQLYLTNQTIFADVDLPLSGYVSQATHQFVKTNGDEFKCSGFVYVKGAKTIEFSARSYTTAGDSCQMVFYNSSKTPITSLDICVNDGIARTIDLTDVAYSDVAYVVMSAYIPGWASSTYFRIKGNYNLDSFLTGDDIDYRTGFNLFDKSAVKQSTAVNNQGEEIARTRCVLSGVIVIPEGASSIHFRGLPTWTTSEGGSVRRYAYYDINWNLIGELATTDCDQASAELGVRTNAKYIKFELYRDMGSEYMPANMNALDNVYVTSNYYPNANFPYHKDIIAIDGNNIAATRYLPYIGKKWTVIGDSLTARTDYTTKTYFDYIQEETGINVVNLGDGGKGWLTGYDGIDHFDNFAMKVPNIPLDTDVVTVFGSFNDIAELDENDFDAVMGDVDDVGYSTICGAMNEFFDELYTRFPSIRVGVITPTPWKTIAPMWTDSPGYKYVQKLKTICEYHSVPYLDLFSCSGLRPWVEANRLAVYSKDLGTGETDPHGTHPNEEGHAIIASRIREFLKTLI